LEIPGVQKKKSGMQEEEASIMYRNTSIWVMYTCSICVQHIFVSNNLGYFIDTYHLSIKYLIYKVVVHHINFLNNDQF